LAKNRFLLVITVSSIVAGIAVIIKGKNTANQPAGRVWVE